MAHGALALGLLLASALLAGCAGPDAPSGVLRGQAMVGPTCPVLRDPPEDECADRPYVGELEASRSGGGAVRFTTNADGSFEVRLPVGAYTLARPGDGLPTCSGGPVTVEAGAYVSSDVSCDSGIR